MKIFISLVVILSCTCIAQQNTFNKEVELHKFVERGGKVEETSPNIYKLTYSGGTQRVFNFNTIANQNNYSEEFDTTIINVWEIDTTLYANKFKFWQRVNIANSNQVKVPIEDINQNGSLELYGRTRVTFPLGGQVDILEQNINGTFHTVHSYDSTSIFVKGVTDINSDGIKEIYLHTTDTNSGKFYKSDSLSALPTTFDFIFYYYTTAQINEMTFGDFDKNGITDCAFMDWLIFIATYDSSINNFSEVTQFSLNDNTAGFAIDDFDGDGKTELVISTGLQGVYIIEAEDTNQYSFVWRGPAPSVNPYMITLTDDIDDNNKPEFWIGGQDFTTGTSTFWCYESEGDNSYKPVAGIELRYLVSLFTFYLQAVDMDNDGVEELVIDIGDYLLMLKFKGNPGQHNYNLYYIKRGEATQPSAIFCPSTIFDMNNDGMKDILLAMDVYPDPDFSYILIQDTLTSVLDEVLQITDKFNLLQNYPNPFNPFTQIQLSIKEESVVKVSVYNILGKELKLLLNENLYTGEYNIQWDGKDNEGNYLSGGVYFIQMIAGSYHKTIKTILLK